MKRIVVILLLLIPEVLKCQEQVVPLMFGDMEQWTVRYIKESSLIGGQVKRLYILGPTDTITVDEPVVYQPEGKTIWGISNAYANIMGVAKAANTTQPERRGEGWCARLDTRMEQVRVVGLVDVKVCIAGTLFLGATIEPVRTPLDPYSKVDMGIPFTGRPKALELDLKTRVSASQKVTKALGFRTSEIDGHDEPEIYLFLQKRWEDENGNIFATRIGTARERFSSSIPEWKNGYRLYIQYGDITNSHDFTANKGLFPQGGQFKARNSKGNMVEIHEVGWGEADDTPTHIILMMTAGCYPAFYGTVGNALWVDNVSLVY